MISEGQRTQEQDGRSGGVLENEKVLVYWLLSFGAPTANILQYNNDIGQGELASCTMPQ